MGSIKSSLKKKSTQKIDGPCTAEPIVFLSVFFHHLYLST